MINRKLHQYLGRQQFRKNRSSETPFKILAKQSSLNPNKRFRNKRIPVRTIKQTNFNRYFPLKKSNRSKINQLISLLAPKRVSLVNY